MNLKDIRLENEGWTSLGYGQGRVSLEFHTVRGVIWELKKGQSKFQTKWSSDVSCTRLRSNIRHHWSRNCRTWIMITSQKDVMFSIIHGCIYDRYLALIRNRWTVVQRMWNVNEWIFMNCYSILEGRRNWKRRPLISLLHQPQMMMMMVVVMMMMMISAG
jgi:hypothetical protein